MKNILFTAQKMNWGMIPRNLGKWLGTTWTVYDDGTFLRVNEYDASQFDNSNSTTNGRKSEVKGEMRPEILIDFKEILVEKFDGCLAAHDCCDGIGWEMCYYAADGTIIHQTNGYIYSKGVLREIAKILESVCC